MGKSIVKEKSFEFAVITVKEMLKIQQEKREYALTKQLIRSSGSVGANIEEGSQAQSKKDFIHKHSISLKEAYESHYWIRLMVATHLLEEEKGKELKKHCDGIIRILTAIVRKAKENQQVH